MESGQIQLQPLVRFDKAAGKCVAQGLPPTFMRHWHESANGAELQAVQKWFGMERGIR
jgi:hypothetical protein